MLHGRNAVITGSTSGIGLGIAEELAKSGANIALNSFTDTPEDHALAREIAETHAVQCVYIRADVSQAEDCRALVRLSAEQLCGPVDILVNNAGIQHVAPLETFPVETWDLILAINLSAAFHTTAVALPMMRGLGWGRIVNIASVHGLTASAYKSAYVAAKHGLVGLTKTTALETARENITCNAICPGYVLTPLVEAQIPDQMETHGLSREDVIEHVMLSRQPGRAFVTTAQIGQSAVFLCSSAADQITGTTLSVDGGWTAL